MGARRTDLIAAQALSPPRVNQQFTGHYLFSDSRMFFERSRFSMIVCAVRAARQHLAMIALALIILGANQARADVAFDRFLESLWPQAQALGVARATFDNATRGLEPDLSLPDLAITGRPEQQPQQPEFVQTPAQYLREPTFARLAAQGKKLAAQYHDTLARIEKEFGVPGNVVLAIWGRETDYGGEKQPHDAIRVLATQAYVGKRKDFFRNEFLHALKMLQDGVPRADLRSSWG